MKDYTTTELLQMLANATITHYQCGGHGKADRNECIAIDYKDELMTRGEPIPSDKELLAIGIFNGEGAV